MNKSNPTPLSVSEYLANSLTGLFITLEDMRFSKNLDESRKRFFHAETIVYLKNGLVHNEEGPAIFFKHGKKYTSVAFLKNGTMSDKNNPSLINYFKSIDWDWRGRKFDPQVREHYVEYWYLGKIHKLDGPATIIKHLDDPEVNNYFIEGKKISKEDFYSSEKVLTYEKMQALKKKMNMTFSEGQG